MKTSRDDVLRPALPPAAAAGARTLALLCALAAPAACAPAGAGGATTLPVAADRPTAADSVDATAAPGPPIVQLRDFPSASSIAIRAWTPDAAAYGLQARVGRDGSLHGGVQRGDHRLYMSTFYVNDKGGFSHAVAPDGTLLRHGGAATDTHACDDIDRCAPRTTVGVSVPDALLRANRDSLVVDFRPGAGRAWSVTLRRELIAAYLGAVDSVAAARRR